jgi:uncharacterized RDD family membrane protein YckC
MNPPDVQSDPEPEYFDPEEADMSEQKFLASLDAEASRPEFVLDESVALAHECRLENTQAEAVAVSLAAELPTQELPEQFTVQEPQPAAMSEYNGISGGATGRNGGTVAEHRPTPDDWRSVVSAKVNKYKARRPQQERYPSLSLPFDTGPYRPPAPVTSRAAKVPCSPDPEIPERDAPPAEPIEQVIPLAPTPPARIVLESTARVLEFPKPPKLWDDELAEPVIDRPRIVEAPEFVPPPPAMGGILIEPPVHPEPERRLGFDVPLQSATLGRKVAAALFDSTVVAVALTVFGYVFFRLTGAAVPWRMALPWTVVVLALLWAGYQYAFLVYTKTTPGLRVARLYVSRFDGTSASRRVVRWRVITSLLSCAALGLGYAWCFLDEDQLSWHDRITRTHLAPKANSDSAH